MRIIKIYFNKALKIRLSQKKSLLSGHTIKRREEIREIRLRERTHKSHLQINSNNPLNLIDLVLLCVMQLLEQSLIAFYNLFLSRKKVLVTRTIILPEESSARRNSLSLRLKI